MPFMLLTGHQKLTPLQPAGTMHHRRKSSLNRTPSSSPRSSVCSPNLRKASRRRRPLFVLALAIGIPVLCLILWTILKTPPREQQQQTIVQVSLDINNLEQGGTRNDRSKADVVLRDEVPPWVRPEASLNFPYPTVLGRGVLCCSSERI